MIQPHKHDNSELLSVAHNQEGILEEKKRLTQVEICHPALKNQLDLVSQI